jgi:hypothetical protein
MSNVSGTISVNVEFRDTTTSSGVQSLKTVTLREATEYTSGKVAIVTGTVAAEYSVLVNLAAYRNASGQTATFTVRRAAFQSTKDACLTDGTGFNVLRSNSSRVSVGDADNSGEVVPLFTSGTAAWTVVLWGD